MALTSVGGYEFNAKDLIGHGAFAVVYKGRQKSVSNLNLLPLISNCAVFLIHISSLESNFVNLRFGLMTQVDSGGNQRGWVNDTFRNIRNRSRKSNIQNQTDSDFSVSHLESIVMRWKIQLLLIFGEEKTERFNGIEMQNYVIE